jgi:hypothetical protein
MSKKKLSFQATIDDMEQALTKKKDVVSTCMSRVLGVKMFVTKDGVYAKYKPKKKTHTVLLGTLCEVGIKKRDKLNKKQKLIEPFEFEVALDAAYEGKSEKFRDYAIDMTKAEAHSKSKKKT